MTQERRSSLVALSVGVSGLVLLSLLRIGWQDGFGVSVDVALILLSGSLALGCGCAIVELYSKKPIVDISAGRKLLQGLTAAACLSGIIVCMVIMLECIRAIED